MEVENALPDSLVREKCDGGTQSGGRAA